MSWRRVHVLVKGLPADAAIWRNDPELGGWTVSDHLLATLIETVDTAGWRSVMPHLKKGAKPKPLTIPRPGITRKRKKRKATAAELRQMFGGGVYVEKG